MGTIQHHSIVITVGLTDDFKHIFAKASALFDSAQTSTQYTYHNGYHTVFIGPDGSKESWERSSKGNDARAEMVAWLREHDYNRWLEITYGELGQGVVNKPYEILPRHRVQ